MRWLFRPSMLVVVSAALSALIYIPVIHSVGDDLPYAGWGHIYLCALIGLVITALLVGITEYYTGTRFGPVQRGCFVTPQLGKLVPECSEITCQPAASGSRPGA